MFYNYVSYKIDVEQPQVRYFIEFIVIIHKENKILYMNIYKDTIVTVMIQ